MAFFVACFSIIPNLRAAYLHEFINLFLSKITVFRGSELVLVILNKKSLVLKLLSGYISGKVFAKIQ